MSRHNRPHFARPEAPPLAPSVPAPAPAASVAAQPSAEEALRAEVEALKAQLAALSPAAPAGARNVCRVGWCAIHYGKRDHAPGEPFPFDLANPPADVAPGFVESLEEGVHYVWTAE